MLSIELLSWNYNYTITFNILERIQAKENQQKGAGAIFKVEFDHKWIPGAHFIIKIIAVWENALPRMEAFKVLVFFAFTALYVSVDGLNSWFYCWDSAAIIIKNHYLHLGENKED